MVLRAEWVRKYDRNCVIATWNKAFTSSVAERRQTAMTLSRLNLRGVGKSTGIERETFAGSAYTARPLLHLLVRTNRKSKCKELWADFTRLGHRGLKLRAPADYCQYRSKRGIDKTRLYPPTYEWERLKKEATSTRLPVASRELLSRNWLLAFWWQVAPHRFDTDTCRYLAGQVVRGWGT